MRTANRELGAAAAAVNMWSTVELRELRTFLTVAEQLHFGRAADQLGINHSRVSQIIRGLEVKVGGRLFERTSRRVRLTPLGEQLRDNLVQPYTQLERGFRDARDVAIGVAGVLRVGMYMRLSGGPHWQKILRTFTLHHPDCAVQIIDTKFDRNYLDALRQGEVDLLATRLPLTDPDVTVGPILSHEERVLLVTKEDPVAKRRSVCLEDVAGRPIADAPAWPREMIDSFFPPATPSGRRFPRIQLRSTEEMVMLVAAGQLVHPTVASFLDYYSDDTIVAVPIRDLPPSETALVWMRANRSAKVQAFAQAAVEVLTPANQRQLGADRN
jgi:DNA-binding transcriptional LysR family regulator